jgi:hypothetical protein
MKQVKNQLKKKELYTTINLIQLMNIICLMAGFIAGIFL